MAIWMGFGVEIGFVRAGAEDLLVACTATIGLSKRDDETLERMESSSGSTIGVSEAAMPFLAVEGKRLARLPSLLGREVHGF